MHRGFLMEATTFYTEWVWQWRVSQLLMVQVWTLDGKFALFWKLGKPNLPVSFEYPINLPEVRMFTRNGKHWNISVEKETIWLKEEYFTWKRKSLTLFMERMAPQSSMYCFRSRSKYSNTNVKLLSVCTMSWRVTENKGNLSSRHWYLLKTKGRPDWPLFDPRPIFTIRSPASLADAAPSRCKINKLGTKEKKRRMHP